MSDTTSAENSQPQPRFDNICQAQRLRQLREMAGMDLVVLARRACLSVAQVRELETNGSDRLFYSEAIKRQAYKRMFMILGAEPPVVDEPEALHDGSQLTEAHANTLAQIAAMSEQPALERNATELVRAGLTALTQHRPTWALLSLCTVALALFAFHGVEGTVEWVHTSLRGEEAPPESVATLASAPALAASSPAPASLASAPVNALNTTAACAYTREAMPELSPSAAYKAGRYVHLVSTDSVELCVIDGNKQATTVQLNANENRSVYGVSPWQVSGANLQKVQIYFQGGRVTLPDAGIHRVKLVELPLSH